jgi:hypothetical protein
MKRPNDIKRPNSRSGSLGQFFTSRAVMVHESCAAWMAPNPFDPLAPWIPHVQKPGITYKAGRNKAKRKARHLRKSMRVAARGTGRALRGQLPLAA